MRLRDDLRARKDEVDRALAELDNFSSDQAARALNRDRSTFTVYEKRGKVYPAKSGKSWNFPVHHVARYFEGLWADQWDRAATDVGPKFGHRFPLLSGVTVNDLSQTYNVDLDLLNKAISFGYLRATEFENDTYVFLDDFVNFVRVNKGIWLVMLILRGPDGKQAGHPLDKRIVQKFAETFDVELEDKSICDENGRILEEYSTPEARARLREQRKAAGETEQRVVHVLFPGDRGYQSPDFGYGSRLL